MTYVASSAPAFLSTWHTADNSSAALDTVGPPRQRKRFGFTCTDRPRFTFHLPWTMRSLILAGTRSGGEAHSGANTIHSNQAVKILMHTEQLLFKRTGSTSPRHVRAKCRAARKSGRYVLRKQTDTSKYSQNVTRCSDIPSEIKVSGKGLAWFTMGCMHHYLGHYLLSCLKYKRTGLNRKDLTHCWGRKINVD